MTTYKHLAIILAASASLLACDPGEPQEIEQTRSAPATAAPEPAPTVTTPEADPTVAAEQGSLEQRIMDLQPQVTRAKWLRFTDPVIHEPGAHLVLLARLDAAEDSPEVRAAVAEAIGRTGADYAAEVSARIQSEQDLRVRELLVGTLGRRAPGTGAHAGLLAGLADEDALVRAVAARVLAERSDGAEFGDQLIGLIGDSDAKVRADASRSAGVLALSGASSALQAGLEDADPKVRVNSLRALSRIAPENLAQAELGRLANDEDPHVSRLATQLLDG